MESGSEEYTTKLCVVAIQAIRDLDTHATASSPVEVVMTVSPEEDDDDSDEMGFVTMQMPDSTKKFL